jgi:exodeoxyribonuclease-5
MTSPFPEKISIGDKYGPAMKITDPAEAAAYFERAVEHTMSCGRSRPDAERIERANFGYYAGYYDNETRERVERLFNCSHPVFGKISAVGAPTTEEALQAGQESGLMTDWSPQQDAALKAVANWLRAPGARPWFYLAGYAGTGKSTLARHLAAGIDGKVVFGAFTGKAALVMRSKGCEGASTIHSMIYTLDEAGWGGEPRFILNQESAVADAKLVVIDEVSMVGAELARDLLSFNTPILVLGDQAQLPPVKDAGFFTEHTPDFMLTEVHRQARDNPIIALSMDVREGKRLSRGSYGESRVIDPGAVDREEVLAADQVLVGLNRSRRTYNARIRTLRQFTGELPNAGERIICLRNNQQNGLLNGQMWNVDGAELRTKGRRKTADPTRDVALKITDDMTGRKLETQARIEDFRGENIDLPWQELRGYDRFDFGYAITVHKAQGSQWANVYLFDESGAFSDDRARLLYTGITRAAERITVVA